MHDVAWHCPLNMRAQYARVSANVLNRWHHCLFLDHRCLVPWCKNNIQEMLENKLKEKLFWSFSFPCFLYSSYSSSFRLLLLLLLFFFFCLLFFFLCFRPLPSYQGLIHLRMSRTYVCLCNEWKSGWVELFTFLITKTLLTINHNTDSSLHY